MNLRLPVILLSLFLIPMLVIADQDVDEQVDALFAQ